MTPSPASDLEAIGLRCAALPVLDEHSEEEIPVTVSK